MSIKWRTAGVLAAAIMGASACGATAPEAAVDVVPGGEQSDSDAIAGAQADGGGSVVNSATVETCAGRYTGRFDGDESGVVAVAVGANGAVVTSAYPGLDVGYSDDGFIRIDGPDGSVAVGPDGIVVEGEQFVAVGPDGVVVGGDGGVVVDPDGGVEIGGGTDGEGGVTVDPDGEVNIGGDGGVTVDPDGGVTIGGGGVTIDPNGPPQPRRQAVEVGPGGISIGEGDGVVVTTGTGQVGDDGLVSIVTDDDRVMTGTFDWTTCTGAGTWTASGTNGSWRVAQDTAQLHVPDQACDSGVFVGSGDEVLVGPGGVSVGSGGVSVGGGAVEVTPEGVAIGSGVVDLDAICVSEAAAAGEPVTYDEVDESVTVQEGDDVVSYGIDGDLLFAFNSAEVDAVAGAALDSIIASVAERYPGRPLQILGHTDSIGTEEANIELSEARAQAVAVIIASDDRMAGVSIQTFGLGESAPVAANANPDGTDNPTGRALNRRVEVVVQTG